MADIRAQADDGHMRATCTTSGQRGPPMRHVQRREAVGGGWRVLTTNPGSLGRCATYGQVGFLRDLSCVVCFETNGLCVKKKECYTQC